MKKVILILSFMIWPFISFAEETVIKELSLGAIRLDGSFYLSSASAFARQSIYETVHSKGKASFEFLPLPLRPDVAEMADLEKEIQDELDEEEDIEEGTAPEMEMRFGQKSSLVSTSLLVPYKRFAFGFSYQELMTLDLRGMANGIDALIEADSENEEENVVARLRPDLKLNLEAELTKSTLRFGGMIRPFWSAEALVDFYRFRGEFDLKAGADGIATALGSSYEFNTNEDNSLDQSINGSYSSSSQGIRLGTNAHLYNGKLNFLALFNSGTDMELEGSLSMVTHKPEAMEELDVSDPTRTTLNEQTAEDPIKIKIPSSLRAEVAWHPGKTTKLCLGATFYLGDYELEYYSDAFYDPFDSEADTTPTKKLESEKIEVGPGFDLGFYSRFFNLKLGATIITVDEETIPMPSCSIGFGIPLGKHWQLDQSILALPFQVFKSRLSYSF